MKIKKIVLDHRPKGEPDASIFRFEEGVLDPLKEGEVLIEPLYFSVDPYMRARMNEAKSYIPPFQVNEPIEGGVVGKVKESRSNNFKENDYVMGSLPWATASITDGSNLRKVDPDLAPLSYYLGVLGMPGLTAYFGMLDIGKPKEGETVLISGAAGAVGMVAGQIAKIKGCRVVGIAGSEQKINLLKEYGFDEGIDYKTASHLGKAIRAACPKGVDVYFDNVGGEVTDAVFPNINFFSRIVLCGQISLYNESSVPVGPRFLPIVVTRSALIQGFIVTNYFNRSGEAIKQLAQWIKEGKMQFKETTLEGFDKLPEAFFGLFTGKNEGKMLVKV
jgi:NADPH:quinone reductase